MPPEPITTRITKSMEELAGLATSAVRAAERMLKEANDISMRIEARMKEADLAVLDVLAEFEAAEDQAREAETILVAMREAESRVLALSR